MTKGWVLSSWREQAQLVMKNGETQSVWYDAAYDVFILEKYSGCYEIKN